MRPRRCLALPLLFAALGSAQGPALGGDSPAELALKAKGLTRAARTFYDAEAEKPALARIREIRATSYAAFAAAVEKQAMAEGLQVQVAQLEEQRLEYQAAITALNQQIQAQNASMGGGRYARAARSMAAPLQLQQQQATAAMNQVVASQKSIKAQVPSAKDKAALDADVLRKGEDFKAALAELRKMVDEVTARYAALNADESVKKALADLEKAGHARITVGPSEPFAAEIKELDQAERRFLGKKPAAAAKKKAKDKAKAKDHDADKAKAADKAGDKDNP